MKNKNFGVPGAEQRYKKPYSPPNLQSQKTSNLAIAHPLEQARDVFSKRACVAAPENSRVNYVSNPAFRQDVTEGQVGVALTLQVTVMDVTTCQPLPNVMVEVWSANALGNYGSSFLRGGFTTSSNGVAEFQTIFPGHTSDGANHFNLMIHTSSSMSGSVSHVGQVFFTDQWTNIVSMYSNYAGNTHTRILNAQDPNYKIAASSGYNPIVDISSIHDDWPEGVIGKITVGVDPSRKV